MEGYSRVYWWMAWQNMLMKDVVTCDKLRWGGKQPLTRRFPNGETRLGECPVTLCWIYRYREGTQGSETSQYLEEKKIMSSILISMLDSSRLEMTNRCFHSLSSGERKGNSPNLSSEVSWSSSSELRTRSERCQPLLGRCCKPKRV